MKIAEKKRTAFRQVHASVSLQTDPIRIHTGPLENADEPVIDNYKAVVGDEPAGLARKSMSIQDQLSVSERRKWRRMSGRRKSSILRRAKDHRNLQEALEGARGEKYQGQQENAAKGAGEPQMERQTSNAAKKTRVRKKDASRTYSARKSVGKVPRTAKSVARKSVRLIRRSAGGGFQKAGSGAEEVRPRIMSRAARIGIEMEASLIKTMVSCPPLGIALLVILIIFIISSSIGGSRYAGAAGGDGYIAEAIRMAEDNRIGYDMGGRRYLNPDVDCSSLVYYALVNSDYPELKERVRTPFVTSSMGGILKGLGFQEIPYSRDALAAGDIVVKPYLGGAGHTEIYIGDGQTVGAHSDYDGVPGDSSGTEVNVGPLYGSFVYIYRPTNVPESGTFVPQQGASHAETAFAALVQGGLSEAAAAGIVGNMFAETAYMGEDLNPHITESNGEGIGLVQWSFGNKTNFLAYAASKNDPWPNTSVKTQMEFLLKQLDEGKWGWSPYTARHYPAKDNITYEEFKTVSDPEFAAEVFCAKFEVPKFELARLDYRKEKAKEIYQKYGGGNYTGSGLNYGMDFSEILGGEDSPFQKLGKVFSLGGG